MAFPQFDAASQDLFVAGPNGYPIPKAYASNFNLPEPPAPIGPPPTFGPGDLAPPPELAPIPAATSPLNPAAAAFQNASHQFNAPAPAINDNTISPFGAEPQTPPTPELAPPPQSPLELTQRGYEQKKRGAQMAADAESTAGQAESKARNDAIVADDLAEKQRTAERERAQKELKLAGAKQDSALDAYMNHKVDQNRMWHNMTTGRKVMAGIALAMGGLGGALAAKNNGGKVVNPALDIIQKAVEDDVRLQMAERDKLGKTYEMRRTAYGDMRQHFSDDEAAFQAARAAAGKKVQQNIDAIIAQTKDPLAKARLESLNGDLDIANANSWDQAKLREEEKRRADAQLAISRGQLGVSQGNLALARTAQKRADDQFEFEKGWKAADFAQENAKNLIAAQQKLLTANKGLSKEERDAQKDALDRETKIAERTVFGPDGEKLEPLHGGSFSVADPERARELQKTMTNGTKMIRMADELVRLRDKYGWSSDLAKSPEFQKMRQVYSEMQLTEKDVKQLGALSGSDMGMITGVLGTDDPTGMRDPTEGVRAFRGGMVSALDDDARLAGVKFDARKSFPELTTKGVQDATKDTPVGALNKAAYRTAEPGSYEQFKGRTDALAKSPGAFLENKPVPSGGAATAALMLVGPAANGDKKAKQALDVMARSGNPEIRKLIGDIAKSNPSLGIKVE